MKPRPGLASTAHNYLSTTLNPKSQQFKCQNCHLQFQSSLELFNHTKKFCTNSGFDTLAGLNIKLKNPTLQKEKSKRNFNDSLTNALEQVQKNKPFLPKQNELQNDLLSLQRHHQDIHYARPYLHGSRNNHNSMHSESRKSRSLYMRPHENEQKNNYGQKSAINYENTQDQHRSKAYSFTSSYRRKFKQSNAYISPPTQLPGLQQNAKQFSLLDRSDMSIKHMPEQQKREYVIRKILQLEQIEEGYEKNGGKNENFIENTRKMKKFYQQLLQKVNKQQDSMFGNGKVSNGTRVSTPISKLDRLQQSGILTESLVRREGGRSSMIKSKISQIQQKNLARRQEQVRRRFHTQAEERSNKKLQQLNDILQQESLRKIMPKHDSHKQNQIIVIPIQQPTSIPAPYPHPQQQTQQAIKYMQSLSALKDEQNRNFLQQLQKQNQQMKKMYQQQMKNKEKQAGKNQNKLKSLQNKYQKLVERIDRQRQRQRAGQGRVDIQENRFRISMGKRRNETESSFSSQPEKQYRQLHPQIDNIRLLNLQSPGYHTPQNQLLSSEQKILLQMQKQERDELQLFAHLPDQIQKLKLASILQLGEKRFEMEKEVIKQKLQKLKLSEEMKQFQLQRRLLTEQMENEKKKIMIHKLMKKKIKTMVREEFQQQQSDDQNSLQRDEINNDYLQQDTPRAPSRLTKNSTNLVKI